MTLRRVYEKTFLVSERFPFPAYANLTTKIDIPLREKQRLLKQFNNSLSIPMCYPLGQGHC